MPIASSWQKPIHTDRQHEYVFAAFVYLLSFLLVQIYVVPDLARGWLQERARARLISATRSPFKETDEGSSDQYRIRCPCNFQHLLYAEISMKKMDN